MAVTEDRQGARIYQPLFHNLHVGDAAADVVNLYVHFLAEVARPLILLGQFVGMHGAEVVAKIYAHLIFVEHSLHVADLGEEFPFAGIKALMNTRIVDARVTMSPGSICESGSTE